MIMSKQELAMYLELIRVLEGEIDDKRDHVEMLKREVKDYLEAQGVTSVNAGKYKVYWTPVTTHRLDVKKLQNDYPALAEKYDIVSTTRRFTIR